MRALPCFASRMADGTPCSARPGFVMTALLCVVKRAFMIDHGAHRIGEHTLRSLTARITNEIDLVSETVVETNERAVRECAMRVQLLRTGRIEIRCEALERYQPRLVFHDDGVVVLGKAEVEQIGQAPPPIRLPP